MKLTNYHRDSIADAATKFAFDPRKQALDEVGDALAREAYESVFSLSQRVAAAALPKHWFCYTNNVKFNVGGLTLSFPLTGDALPLPFLCKGTDNVVSYGGVCAAIPHGKLCDRMQTHAQAVENLKQERKAARAVLRNLLAGFTTVKAMQEAWPEGEAFYANLAPDTPKLPAVSMADINKRFGLPSEVAGE